MIYIESKSDLSRFDKVDWNYLSEKCFLSEDFIEEHSSFLNWRLMSIHQIFSVSFMIKYAHKLDWKYVSSNQYLCEQFGEDYIDIINLESFVIGQDVSEKFLDKYKDNFKWSDLCQYVPLSDEFINNHLDYIDWFTLSKAPLNKDFIVKHKDKLDPTHISVFQTLDEEFIASHYEWLKMEWIAEYQDISDGFRLEYGLVRTENNWLNYTTKYKLGYINMKRLYDMDDEYVYAYKACRLDGYSTYSRYYKYNLGSIHTSSVDCTEQTNSFGLSVGTLGIATNYYPHQIVKVRIRHEDIGVVLFDNSMRVKRLEVIEIL